MSDNQVGGPTPDDIVDTPDTRTDRLDRAADAILAADAASTPAATAETRGRGAAEAVNGPASIRQSLRDDLDAGRLWARDRSDGALESIRQEPLRATFYALGAGVLIGLLLRR